MFVFLSIYIYIYIHIYIYIYIYIERGCRVLGLGIRRGCIRLCGANIGDSKAPIQKIQLERNMESEKETGIT